MIRVTKAITMKVDLWGRMGQLARARGVSISKVFEGLVESYVAHLDEKEKK